MLCCVALRKTYVMLWFVVLCYVVDNKYCVVDDKCCVVDDKCCVVDEEVCAASCVRVRSSGNQGVVHCFASKHINVYQYINLLSSFCLRGSKMLAGRPKKLCSGSHETFLSGV